MYLGTNTEFTQTVMLYESVAFAFITPLRALSSQIMKPEIMNTCFNHYHCQQL